MTVHKDDNMMIMCKGKPIMVEARSMHTRYQIPLVQQKGTWKSHKLSKKAREYFQQTNNMYDLPPTE